MVGNTLCQYKAKRDDAPQIFGFDFHVSAAIPRLHRGPLKPAGSTRKFDISPEPTVQGRDTRTAARRGCQITSIGWKTGRYCLSRDTYEPGGAPGERHTESGDAMTGHRDSFLSLIPRTGPIAALLVGVGIISVLGFAAACAAARSASERREWQQGILVELIRPYANSVSAALTNKAPINLNWASNVPDVVAIRVLDSKGHLLAQTGPSASSVGTPSVVQGVPVHNRTEVGVRKHQLLEDSGAEERRAGDTIEVRHPVGTKQPLGWLVVQQRVPVLHQAMAAGVAIALFAGIGGLLCSLGIAYLLRRPSGDFDSQLSALRKERTAALGARQLLEQLVDSMPVAMFVKDSNGQMVFANKSATEQFEAVEVHGTSAGRLGWACGTSSSHKSLTTLASPLDCVFHDVHHPERTLLERTRLISIDDREYVIGVVCDITSLTQAKSDTEQQ